MNGYATEERVILYQWLAEAFAEPATWSVNAGERWPLYDVALQVAEQENNTALHQAALALTLIPSASLSQRQKHYQHISSPSVYPNCTFYESLARGDRLGGMTTIAVWTVYQSVGLQVDDSLSPDHISVELAFLAFLLEQECTDHENATQWKRARKLFVKRHVGQWLPALGDALSANGDPIYAPLGRILAISICSELPTRKPQSTHKNCQVPVMTQPDNCTLCNFCAQACPTHTLSIREDSDSTRLIINDKNCLSCKKCVAVCPTSALELSALTSSPESRVLYTSPRCRCSRCSAPTVSQAEINAIIAQIGNPNWLNYCSDCRAML